MPARKAWVKKVGKVANRAVEIYRKNNIGYPLAVDKATREVENLTEEQRLKLKEDTHEELRRRGQIVRVAKSHHKRVGNRFHSGVGSSISHARKKIGIGAIKMPKVGNTTEERRRQKKLEQQTREAEAMAKERHDELLPHDD